MIKLPNATLEKLRCIDCTSYLSCGPIAVFPTGQASCGRCKIVQPAIVCNTYSVVANAFIFPCKYDKCPAILSWSHVVDHEDKCSYRARGCLCCKQPGALKKSMGHIQERAMVPYTPPMSVMDQLKCIECNGYLAARPIFLTPMNGQNICHRCGPGLNYPTTRNVPLETVLESYMFKCSYRNYGCQEFRKFGGDSFNHEMECRFKDICEGAHTGDRNNQDQARLERAREIMYQATKMEHYDNNGYERDEDTSETIQERDEIETSKQNKKIKGALQMPRGVIYATITPQNVGLMLSRDNHSRNAVMKEVFGMPSNDKMYGLSPRPSFNQKSNDSHRPSVTQDYARAHLNGHNRPSVTNSVRDFDNRSETASTHTRHHSGASSIGFTRQESIPLERKDSVLNQNVTPIYKDIMKELKYRQKGHQ